MSKYKWTKNELRDLKDFIARNRDSDFSDCLYVFDDIEIFWDMHQLVEYISMSSPVYSILYKEKFENLPTHINPDPDKRNCEIDEEGEASLIARWRLTKGK